MRYVSMPLGGQEYVRAYHAGPQQSKHIPIHGSIAIYTKMTGPQEVGTMSCIVWDSAGKPYILSNQHVLYPNSASPRPKAGDLVYQVGDGVPIGKLYRTIAEPNPWPAGTSLSSVGTYHDSALAEATVEVSDEVNGIGKITGVADPVVGMKVRFNGRTSGLQKGKVTAINKTYNNPVAGGKVSIVKNVFMIDATTAPGDSGSLVVTDDNKALGLMYGGGNCCLASVIAQKYGVSFVKPTSGAPTTPTTPTPNDQKIDNGLMVGGGILAAGLVLVLIAAGSK